LLKLRVQLGRHFLKSGYVVCNHFFTVIQDLNMSGASYSFPVPEVHPVSVIATIRSEFKTKGAVPRQPNVIQGLRGTVVLERTTEKRQWIRGLDEFSHIWILFLFHANGANKNRPIVQPPPGREVAGRGVFATRSPYRPNPIGLSAVRLIDIQTLEKEIHINFEGGDFLDGTPVIDIKPYIPYADCVSTATGAWASSPPVPQLCVEWSDEAKTGLLEAGGADFKRLFTTITDVIGHDPRPFHHRFATNLSPQKEKVNHWNFVFGDLKVFFSVSNRIATISDIRPATNSIADLSEEPSEPDQ
jgi:tRNA-Thr(GGU) m(6)t(6)A37 methyltransferase TsaA